MCNLGLNLAVRLGSMVSRVFREAHRLVGISRGLERVSGDASVRGIMWDYLLHNSALACRLSRVGIVRSRV